MEFKRKKDFFVGIDSDGTAFDSMTIKHTFAFIPTMEKEWNLERWSESLTRIAERINLYSTERGINRFPGLLRTFEELEKELGDEFPIKDYEGLRQFIQSGCPMSNCGLEEYMASKPSRILEQTLRWSKTADGIFARQTETLPPFAGVASALQIMGKTADLMVVSAASYEGLVKDWTRAGLSETVDYIAGQELGGKEKQLAAALESGYEAEKCLMIGDALGDQRAAKKNGVCFYPIIPSREEECWQALTDIYYPMFLRGTYAGKTEETLYNKFLTFLENGKQEAGK